MLMLQCKYEFGVMLNYVLNLHSDSYIVTPVCSELITYQLNRTYTSVIANTPTTWCIREYTKFVLTLQH